MKEYGLIQAITEFVAESAPWLPRVLAGGACLGVVAYTGYQLCRLGAEGIGWLGAKQNTFYGRQARMPRRETPQPVEGGKELGEPYGIYIIENVAGGSVWLGQVSQLRGKNTCDFQGGGLGARQGGADIPLQYRLAVGDDGREQRFDSLQEADAAFCQALRNNPPTPYWMAHNWKAHVFGGDYWLATATAASCKPGETPRPEWADPPPQ